MVQVAVENLVVGAELSGEEFYENYLEGFPLDEPDVREDAEYLVWVRRELEVGRCIVVVVELESLVEALLLAAGGEKDVV